METSVESSLFEEVIPGQTDGCDHFENGKGELKILKYGPKSRVVVTGLGMVTPLAVGVKETWKSLCEGNSGVKKITRFDAVDFTTKIAGEVTDFHAEEFINKKEAKRMDLFSQFAVVSSVLAVDDSGLKIYPGQDERVGVVIGTGIGGLSTIEKYHKAFLDGGPKKISPFFIPMQISNMASGHVSMHFGAKGPNCCVVSACASGAHAIGEACGMIQRNDVDVMIAGGVEAPITPLGVGGFCAMKALSTNNDEPKKASRPFEKNRDGFVVSEGGGVIVLEKLEFAINRGAKIYGEVMGYGLSSDAYHISAPSPNGEGAARCMSMAIKNAGILPGDIDYINAHGTSTLLNDLYETIAIKEVFQDYARKLAISSTKSMTGHLLGAAGGVEAIFSLLSLRDSILPPTINYETPDPDCDLDYVPNYARKKDINIVMSNSFGFGGTNCSLIFSRYPLA